MSSFNEAAAVKPRKPPLRVKGCFSVMLLQ